MTDESMTNEPATAADVEEFFTARCAAMAFKGIPDDTVEAGLISCLTKRLIETRGWDGAAARLREAAEDIEEPEIMQHVGNA